MFAFTEIFPARPVQFLEWARNAGLLRVTGIAYQCRHDSYQQWLAAGAVGRGVKTTLDAPRSKAPWLILGEIALLGVIALALGLVIGLSNSIKSTMAGPEHTATGCTPNVSGGENPAGDTISAGKLSFPASATPGWSGFSDDQTPNLIAAVSVGQDVPGANQWMMTAEVATTNFVTSMDVSAQASKLMDCVANGPGYANASPTLGPPKTSSITVDGVNAARVDADVTIADTSRNVKGDSLTIIAVDTKPITVFLGTTPIGDTGSAAIISKVIAALKVSKT